MAFPWRFQFFDKIEVKEPPPLDSLAASALDAAVPSAQSAVSSASASTGNSNAGSAGASSSSSSAPSHSVLERLAVTCSSSGMGHLIFGDAEGKIHIFDRSFRDDVLDAYEVQVTHLRQLKHTPILISIGDDGTGVNSGIIKVWHLERRDKRNYNQPMLLRTIRLFSGKTEHKKVTCLDVTEDIQLLAVGLSTGEVVLLRGDLTRAKQIMRVFVVDKFPVAGVGFNRYRDQSVCMFVVTENIVVAYRLNAWEEKQFDLDPVGCKPGCVVMSDTHELVIGSEVPLPPIPVSGGPASSTDDKQHQASSVHPSQQAIMIVRTYNLEGKGASWAFPGKYKMLSWFKSYLLVVSEDEPSSKSKPSLSSGSAADRRGKQAAQLNTGSNSPSVTTLKHQLNIYDTNNKLVAYTEVFSGITHILHEWGSIFVLCNETQSDQTVVQKLYELVDKDIQSKLDIIFKKRTQNNKTLFEVAIQLANSERADHAYIIDITRKFADYLYSNKQYEKAIDQYIKTIGKLEPSYVIRKFLEPQRIQNLTRYLEELHKRDIATAEHTSLLLNCYTKLKDMDKLDRFIHKKDAHFNVDTAINVCRQSGYIDHALRLSADHQVHASYLKILIEDKHNYEEALHHIESKIEKFEDMTKYIQLYGKSLLQQLPEETTNLLIRLCMIASTTPTRDSPDVTSLATANKAKAKSQQRNIAIPKGPDAGALGESGVAGSSSSNGDSIRSSNSNRNSLDDVKNRDMLFAPSPSSISDAGSSNRNVDTAISAVSQPAPAVALDGRDFIQCFGDQRSSLIRFIESVTNAVKNSHPVMYNTLLEMYLKELHVLRACEAIINSDARIQKQIRQVDKKIDSESKMLKVILEDSHQKTIGVISRNFSKENSAEHVNFKFPTEMKTQLEAEFSKHTKDLNVTVSQKNTFSVKSSTQISRGSAAFVGTDFVKQAMSEFCAFMCADLCDLTNACASSVAYPIDKTLSSTLTHLRKTMKLCLTDQGKVFAEIKTQILLSELQRKKELDKLLQEKTIEWVAEAKKKLIERCAIALGGKDDELRRRLQKLVSEQLQNVSRNNWDDTISELVTAIKKMTSPNVPPRCKEELDRLRDSISKVLAQADSIRDKSADNSNEDGTEGDDDDDEDDDDGGFFDEATEVRNSIKLLAELEKYVVEVCELLFTTTDPSSLNARKMLEHVYKVDSATTLVRRVFDKITLKSMELVDKVLMSNVLAFSQGKGETIFDNFRKHQLELERNQPKLPPPVSSTIIFLNSSHGTVQSPPDLTTDTTDAEELERISREQFIRRHIDVIEEKMMSLLRNPEARYDPNEALIMVQTYNHREGILYMYEKLGFHNDIIQYYMTQRAYKNVIECCKRYSDRESNENQKQNMWIKVLSYFAEMGQEAEQQIQEVLEYIDMDNENMLPPLMVIQILSQKGGGIVTNNANKIKLGTLFGYISRQLLRDQELIAQDLDAINQYAQETKGMLDETENLQTTARMFKMTKCLRCNNPLDLPAVHFMCMHSFHAACLGDSGECPVCEPNNSKVYEIRRLLQESANQHDAFKKKLEDSSDGFITISEYFGRGIFHYGDTRVGVADIDDIDTDNTATLIPTDLQEPARDSPQQSPQLTMSSQQQQQPTPRATTPPTSSSTSLRN